VLHVINAGLLLFTAVSRADGKDSKVIEALRCNSKIKIDGILSERIWHRAGFTKFVERDPNEGTNPTQRTEVWVAYDDEAI